MPITFPDMEPPVIGVSICIQTPFAATPHLKQWVDDIGRSRDICKIDDGGDDPRWLRFIVGKFDEDTAHFHIDVARQSSFRIVPTTNSDIASIQEKFATINGVMGDGYVAAKFLVDGASIPKRHAIWLLSAVEMNLNGVGASLSGGTLKLNHESCRSIAWNAIGEGESRQFKIEIIGFYDQRQVDDEIATWAEARGEITLDRFVLETKPIPTKEKP